MISYTAGKKNQCCQMIPKSNEWFLSFAGCGYFGHYVLGAPEHLQILFPLLFLWYFFFSMFFVFRK